MEIVASALIKNRSVNTWMCETPARKPANSFTEDVKRVDIRPLSFLSLCWSGKWPDCFGFATKWPLSLYQISGRAKQPGRAWVWAKLRKSVSRSQQWDAGCCCYCKQWMCVIWYKRYLDDGPWITCPVFLNTPIEIIHLMGRFKHFTDKS